MDPIMVLARAARAAFALAALLAAMPGAAQVAPRPLAIYPLPSSEGAAGGDASDVQSLLDAALRRAAQRSEDVLVAEPALLRPACGPAPDAALPCLAGLAGPGLVVRAAVRRSESTLVVVMEAVDAKARLLGPVSVSVDAFAQSAEPIAHGLLILVEQAVAADSRRQQADLRPPEPAVPAATAKATAKAAAPARAWMRPAGKWLAGAGVVLVAAGVVVHEMNRSLADDLEAKYRAGALTAADRADYDRVERNDTLTTALLASGGAFTVAGLALWTGAPARGTVVAGLAGRF